jgi:O-antigen/teichoic acid export membrane protein
MNKGFGSITASVGNLVVSKNSNNKTEKVLFKMMFLNNSLYSYICVCMFLLIGEFVTHLWLNNNYYLGKIIIILAVFELFLRAMHYPLYTIRNAFGLFSQFRIIFVIAAVLNIFLDLILVKPLGISGLIIATILCRGITYITDIHVVYRYGFKKTSINYYLFIFKWLIFIVINSLISYLFINQITTISIFNFVFKIIVITIVYLIVHLLFFAKTVEMKYFMDFFKMKFRRNKND